MNAPAKRSKAPRNYKTQRAVDEGRDHVKAMCKALNEKTRLEIALTKYLESYGAGAEEIKAALQSVKVAQDDSHFHLLWNLLEKAHAKP